jgi:hypothetical protein
MERIASQQACQLFIEQEIERGLEEGKTKYAIGQEIAALIEKYFEAKVSPHTIEQRAHRVEEKILTNVSKRDFPTKEQDFEEGPEPERIISGPIGKYEDLDNNVKRCLKCGELWAADLDYCPYCNISPEARQLHIRKEQERQPAPHVSYNTGENEWYTPKEYIEAARKVMGGIDLDPASSIAANGIVRATSFFSKSANGLDQKWWGNVFLNPPYSSDLIKKFTSKFIFHVQSSEIHSGIVLVNNSTETAWFRKLIDSAAAVLFTSHRVKFLDPQGNPGAPLQGQAFIYFGDSPDRFLNEFNKFGWGTEL